MLTVDMKINGILIKIIIVSLFNLHDPNTVNLAID